MRIEELIEIDTTKRFGKPILKGTRITVADVLNWLANGMTREKIMEDFPEISERMISACLLYAASRENHLGFAS